MGLTKADLKNRSQLNHRVINASIKKLEKLDLIQSVKGKDKNRLVFLLAEIDPDDAVTGGMLYEKGEIDQKFVRNIMKKILDY
jgi:hypothetical protein